MHALLLEDCGEFEERTMGLSSPVHWIHEAGYAHLDVNPNKCGCANATYMSDHGTALASYLLCQESTHDSELE